MEETIIKPISNLKSLALIDSFNINNEYRSVLQRYYVPKYCTKIDDKPIDHQCILFHSNRICLITIAPSHPIIKLNKVITKIDFITEGNVDRLKNKVTGKSKRGGQKLEGKSILCRVECNDKTTFDIYSCVKGKLIEINKNLIENPNLLVTKYNTYGHVAIVLADLSKIGDVKDKMLSEEEYNIVCNENN